MTMNELFGVWYQRTPESITKSYAHHHHHTDWPSNHQHYDHQTGESYQLSQLNALATANDHHDNDVNLHNNNNNNNNVSNRTFLSKFFTRLSSWLFPHHKRRQIASRIRARSACIPLVKSRDMDLDDI
ncbi:hypothetical protein HUG17_9180 [Dermatophagoides farinae]|uniref:Uncharacterized protein n=1 Tax=Dermatophagoides farinae TaxID=6954 RepID=A0A9D4NUN5_DERFA|nr:hypothetical protein HUG17_9180 [Dermatophagoides farinae]